MNRNQLLNLASQSVYYNGHALGLAGRMTAPDHVQWAVNHYSKRVVALSARAAWCFSAFMSCVVALFSAIVLMGTDGIPGHWTPDPMWLACAVAGALAAMLLAAAVGLRSAELRDLAGTNLELLAPMVNSPEFQVPIDCGASGEPEVLAWRDLVIAERKVLSAFDMLILRDIRHAVMAAREAAPGPS